MAVDKPNPTFFRTPEAFRRWLEKHHESQGELWVGFYKVGSGKPSITWPQSVDEALCFGWIDGIRKRIDEVSYAIRFTPRKATSTWSAVNTRRVEVLRREARMRPAGERAFAARRDERSGIYSYEQRPDELPEPYSALLRKNRPALAFFAAQAASYRKAVTWWVVSAKQETTRRRRMARLIEDSAAGRRIGPMTRPPRTATKHRPDE